MAETAVYQLSTIDLSIIRAYVRYSLCWPCSDEKVAREEVVANLTASVKRAISYLPILAGNVHSVEHSIENHKQQGKVEVQVTPAQVDDFKPTVNVLDADDFPHSYEELSSQKMPANTFIGDALTPLPDSPDKESDGAPAFTVQANFIAGGVIVCLYLHHSVADLKALAAMIRHMSISSEMLPGVEHTLQSLKDDALEQSRSRDRVSGSRGVKANLEEHPEYDVSVRQPLAPSQGTSRVLTFSLEMLDGTRDMINERFQYMNNEPDVHLSAFDCMAAVLWKAITRARWPPGTTSEKKTSRIFVPVDMAKRLDPPLPEQFYGNSCLFSCVDLPLLQLGLPFDIGSLSRTARRIREGIASMKDPKARSAIAIINECEDVRELNHPNIDFNTDVFITIWANLPVDEESTLGLGLDAPEWTRKVSKGQSAYGCVLLPLKKAQGVWEVTVSLTDQAMARLLSDPGVAPFVLHVA